MKPKPNELYYNRIITNGYFKMQDQKGWYTLYVIGSHGWLDAERINIRSAEIIMVGARKVSKLEGLIKVPKKLKELKLDDN